MPSLIFLVTSDAALAEVWERQVPPGSPVLRIPSEGWAAGSAPGFSAVVVLDAAAEPLLPPSLVRYPTIYVGEPRSGPFEQARLARRARAFLSYEESATRLREFLPLVDELAEKQSMVELLIEKTRRTEPAPPAASRSRNDAHELWDFLEGAVENLDVRERLIAEFRRAARFLLRASHAIFFLREEEGFRADRDTRGFGHDDPLVTFFENRPVIIDGTQWHGPADPVSELAVRNRLVLWGARLLVPVHDNGRLLGLIALGVRDDGQPYDEADHARAVFFARLLRHCLAKSAQLARLHHVAEQMRLGANYLPGTLVLGADEPPPRHVPLVVRELIGRARHTGETCQVQPTATQPYRARAGAVAETGGTWAYWEEAGDQARETLERRRVERRDLLRELALTLSHEIGNTLVSLATFRQSTPEQPLPGALLATVKGDVAKLEALNRDLELMQAMHETDAEPTDLREVVQEVGGELEIEVDPGGEPIVLAVIRRLVEFALRSLLTTIGENRGGLGRRELSLGLRSTGGGSELTALLSIKGQRLELEGILPEPANQPVPNQGRFAVLLSKEILRLHHGGIHAGPGVQGTEILISLRGL